MNIVSFDIEEWFLEKHFYGDRREMYYQYDSYLNQILDKLDERQIKATFFCLGGIAREFPQVIEQIANRGHEFSCKPYNLYEFGEHMRWDAIRTSMAG